MKRTYLAAIKDQVGHQVLVEGWVHVVRNQGGLVFIMLRDRTGMAQLVIDKSKLKIWQLARSLTVESVIAVKGEVKAEQQAPNGVEVGIKSLEVLSNAAPELPIPVNEKESGANQRSRLDWRWLDLRKPEKQLIFQVWTTLEQAFRQHLVERGFVQIHSPKFMSAPSESGAEVFEVKYFNRVAYLAQSPQFYKQMAQAAGLEGVFEIGPVFRADPSFTSRHATEFTGYDVEFSFCQSHLDVMRLESELLRAMLQTVAKQHGEDIKQYYGRAVIVPKLPFPAVTLAEAKTILKERGVPSEKAGDLSPEEERALSEYIKESQGHEFVFITDYPVSARPFYHMRYPDQPDVTMSFDLLWNGLEVTTGAQREHRYDILKEQAEEQGLSIESLKHYLNFFKYGCPPHGGLGIGAARLLMKIFDLDNVREVSFLYRGVKRLTP